VPTQAKSDRLITSQQVQNLVSRLVDLLKWTANRAYFPPWTLDSYVELRFRKHAIIGAACGSVALTKAANMGFLTDNEDELISFNSDVDAFTTTISVVFVSILSVSNEGWKCR
jgi:hypothetical protein